MSQNSPDVWRDPIWQFIGVISTIVLTLVGLLIAAIVLPDPLREIFITIIIMITLLSCLLVYVFVRRSFFKKSFSRKEKASIVGTIIVVSIVVLIILGSVISSYTHQPSTVNLTSKTSPLPANICMPVGASTGNVSTLQIGDTYCIYRGHRGGVNAIAWSPDGKRIASGGNDGTVQIWDATTGGIVTVYRGHKGAVNTVAWSPDGKRIASGGNDGTVQIWLANTGDKISSYDDVYHNSTTNKKPSADPVLNIAWSPDGYTILASWGSGDVVAIKADEGLGNPPGLLYSSPAEAPYLFAWSPDSKRIAFGWFDTLGSNNHGKVQIWDVNADKSILTHIAQGFDVTALAWTPNGRVVAIATDAEEPKYGWVEAWDVTKGNAAPYVHVPIYFSYTRVIALNWACDSEHIALGSISGEVEIWDNVTNKYYIYSGHSKGVVAAVWSPDGTRIASAGGDGTVQVWKASEKPLCTL